MLNYQNHQPQNPFRIQIETLVGIVKNILQFIIRHSGYIDGILAEIRFLRVKQIILIIEKIIGHTCQLGSGKRFGIEKKSSV